VFGLAASILIAYATTRSTGFTMVNRFAPDTAQLGACSASLLLVLARKSAASSGLSTPISVSVNSTGKLGGLVRPS
jgi:hypothetical protein